MSYLKRKKGSLESSILSVWTEAAKKTEGNKFGMALQQAKEKGEKTFTVAGKIYDVKTEKLVGGQKKLDKDKDGDIDGKDFAMLRKEKGKTKKENFEVGTKERRDHTIETTPGQSKEDFEKQVEVMHSEWHYKLQKKTVKRHLLLLVKPMMSKKNKKKWTKSTRLHLVRSSKIEKTRILTMMVM